MDIYVIGLQGVEDIIDSYQSVIWNVQFFGTGDLQLVVAGTPKNIELLTVGKYLVRDFDMSEGVYKNVMLIENRDLHFDVEQGWILTLTGSGLKKILARRIIWQQTNLTGSVEDSIYSIIEENVISPEESNRAIADFENADSKGFSDTFDIQLLGENIAEWLESIGQTYGIGWDVYIQNGKYVFELTKGVDRTYNQNEVVPVVFSPEFDNLVSTTYSYKSADYHNAALIGGEGEGDSQTVASIGTASGLERFETFVDGSSVSSNGEIITLATYIDMLKDFGAEQLAESVMGTETTSGEVIANGMYTLNEDYFLGDIVQISNGQLQAESRITEIIYSEDDTGISIVPTFSNWED